MSDTTTTNTNALGDTPPTVCPRCAGPCTLPGEGPTGQLGGLCTVCGWDYLVVADDVTDGGDPVTGHAHDAERVALGCPDWCSLDVDAHELDVQAVAR